MTTKNLLYRNWTITVTSQEFYGWKVDFIYHGKIAKKIKSIVLDDFYLIYEALSIASKAIDNKVDNKEQLMARNFYYYPTSEITNWVKKSSRETIKNLIDRNDFSQFLLSQSRKLGGIWTQLLFSQCSAARTDLDTNNYEANH